MKTNAFRLITLLMLLVVCGIQNPAQAQKDKIYTEDDVKKGSVKAPFFKKSGDMEQSIKKYLDDNYRAPYSASQRETFVIRFVVEKDGTLSNFDFKEDSDDFHGFIPVDYLVTNELQRVLEAMPKMTPAKKNGKSVRYEAYFYVELTDKLRVYDVADEMPQFPGGINAMFDWLNKNIQYPSEAKKKGIQGRFNVLFIVEKDGSLSNVEVVKRENSSIFEPEIHRLMKTMPKWKPGKIAGEAVRVNFTLPIMFRITD